MRCVVTGCAGFIGSQLSEALIGQGHEVTGIDCFTDYYPRALKEANLSTLRDASAFTLIEADLLEHDLKSLLEGADYVFHQAAQAGVTSQLGQSFAVYTQNNILATQRLLEAARSVPHQALRLRLLVLDLRRRDCSCPSAEDALPRPVSPVRREQACRRAPVPPLLGELPCSHGLPPVLHGLRPAATPGHGLQQVSSGPLLAGDEIVIYGDGNQTRDFTFVSDAVAANLACMESEVAGQVFNMGGGSRDLGQPGAGGAGGRLRREAAGQVHRDPEGRRPPHLRGHLSG